MTVRDTKRRKRQVSDVEGLSSLTMRFEAIETSQRAQGEAVGKLTELMAKLDKKIESPRAMPLAPSPEAQIAAMRGATKIGENVGTTRNVDLRDPKGASGGFQPGQIIQLVETSGKYPAYRFDDSNRPVKAIYEYQCQACARTEEWLEGKRPKKVCPECKSAMLKTATGRYEPGARAAFGVIQNYMYTTKRGIRKYKVYFEQFSERQKSEGLLENEMVLCQ